MHSSIIEVLIKANLPELHERLLRFNLRANIYASEWIFGLFASVIPCEHMGGFFDHFYEQRWPFFYQLVLTLLKRHEKEIRNEEDMYSLLRQIKVVYNENRGCIADDTVLQDDTIEVQGNYQETLFTEQSEESLDLETTFNVGERLRGETAAQ